MRVALLVVAIGTAGFEPAPLNPIRLRGTYENNNLSAFKGEPGVEAGLSSSQYPFLPGETGIETGNVG